MNYAAIDWITATTTDHSAGYSWWSLYCALREEWRTETEDRDWSALGFAGRSLGSPRASWGYRPSDDRYIFIASSTIAHDTWPVVVPLASSVTRLDLAVTFDYKVDDLAKYWYNHVKAFPPDKRLTYRLVENNSGGQTLYIGSRKSPYFGRLYDKGAEQGESPGQRWRYEVEAKGKVAMPAARDLLNQLNRGIPQAEQITAFVWQWFDARGVRPAFPPRGQAWSIKPEVSVTSATKKLTWLRDQVRPSVAWLFEQGRGSEALEALGITPDFLTRMADKEAAARARLDRKKLA